MRKLFFICSTLLFSIALMAQEEAISDIFFVWGKIKIPLHELVNGSNGQIELKLEEVLASANQPMILMKNGKDAKLKNFQLIITHRKNKTPAFLLNIQDYSKKGAKSIHGKAFMKDQLREGENIYFRNLIINLS